MADDQARGHEQQHHDRDEQRSRAAHDELLRAQTDDVDVDAEVPEELAGGPSPFQALRSCATAYGAIRISFGVMDFLSRPK